MQTIQKLLKAEQNLKEALKETRENLKAEVEGTELYKAFMSAITETMPDQVPEKAAAANAYKLALMMLTPKE